MTIEGYENTWSLNIMAQCHASSNDLSVPKVDAIEGANADDRLIPFSMDDIESEMNLHGEISLPSYLDM